MPGPIPEQSIDDVRGRTDIVELIGEHVSLKKRGREFWGCCPFHREKTPSFKVSSEYQSFHCFGCGKSGNAFSFLMEFENLDFPAAVRVLAERVGVVIPERSNEDREDASRRRSRQEQLLEILDSAARWYAQLLQAEDGAPGRQYLESRGVPEEVITDFGLGYARDAWDAVMQWASRRNYSADMIEAAGLLSRHEEKDHCYDRFRGRLMFPIHDHLGRVVGFSGRTLNPEDKGAKYINTPEGELFHKSRLLYGLHRARRTFREHGFALVCEGQLDVIACHRAGLTNAVAPQGTAFTEDQAHMLKRFAGHVCFAFDADSAGQKAAVRSIQVALQANLETSAVHIPEGEDPDSILQGQGAEALVALVQQRQEGFEFLLQVARQQHPGNSPADTTAIVEDLLPALCALDNPVRQSAQISWLAEHIGVPEDAVRQAVDRRLRSNQKRQHRQPPPDAAQADSAPQTMPHSRPQPPKGHAGAEVMLLDLALRHGPVAHWLAENLPPEKLSQTPVGKALNVVLAHTHQGEWTDAAHHVSRDRQLAENPDVGRVLAGTSFPDPQPGENPEREKTKHRDMLHRAMNDAVRALERADLRRQMTEIQQQLPQQSDPEQRQTLLQKYQELARKYAQPYQA